MECYWSWEVSSIQVDTFRVVSCHSLILNTCSVETMSKDFDPRVDKPFWPLSSYGPAKHEPNLLPPLDESFEELRMKAVLAKIGGTLDEYVRLRVVSMHPQVLSDSQTKYEQDKTANAERIFMNVRNNIEEAYDTASKQSPINRDQPGGLGSAFKTGGAFGGGGSAFGKPSAFGALGNSKPVSAFASTNTPTSAPALGQSAFGQTGFGQVTQPTSTFGRPPQPPDSAFGQTAAQPVSAFGQPSQQPTSAFGHPSQQPTLAFGQPIQPTSALGQPVSALGGSGFAAFAGDKPSAFAAVANGNNNNTKGATFVPSAFGGNGSSTQPSSSVFGQSNNSVTTSAFGQAAQQSTSAFGDSAQRPVSAFGQPVPQPSAFGQPTQQPTSAFSQTTSAFGQPMQPIPISTFGTPSTQSQSAFDPGGGFGSVPASALKVVSGTPDFANARSTYKPGLDKYDALLPPDYMSLLPQKAKEAFQAAKFEWGNVPEWVPPMEMR